MRLPDFGTEQWMNLYEGQAVYNLTDTCVESLKFHELLSYEPDALDDLALDYGSITGDPKTRSLILSMYQNQDEDTLTFAQGCLQGNEMVMETLLEPGDHVITFGPGYQQFTDYPKSLGCSVSEIQLDPKDWSLDLAQVEQALNEHPNTRLLILNNPNNPTGSELSLSAMQKLAELCQKHDVCILCDEVYKHPDSPSMSDLYEKAVSTGSLSKLYGLAGLRFGWIKGNPQLIHDINVRRDYSIISTGPLKDQLVWIALAHHDELLERGQKIIQENRQVIEEWLQDNPLFSCIMPRDCTVAFLRYHKNVPSEQFARDLLRDTGIFFVPGICFGKEHHLRLAFGRKQDDLPPVLQTLQTYLEAYPEHP